MAGIDAGGERRAGRQPRADRRAAAQRTFTIISDGEPGWSLAMAGVVAIARGWLPVDEGADLVIIDGRAGLRVPAPSMGAAYRLLVVGRLDDAAVAAVAAGLADDAIVIGDQRGLALRLAAAGRVIDGRRRAAGLVGRAQRRATTDTLTGAGNRLALASALPVLVRRVRSGSPAVVAIVDLDDFRKVNAHGHLAGDEALRQVARAIAGCLRDDNDGIFRFGGDEFVVLLNRADGATGTQVAERIRAAVAGLTVGTAGARVTASIGFVALPAGCRAAGIDVFQAADEGLLRAKAEGRNRACLGVLPDVSEADRAAA